MQRHIKKLDLHGLKHTEVSRICHNFINAHWGKCCELHIITGHSQEMKLIVEEVLNNYVVEYMVGDLRNSGYIKVFL